VWVQILINESAGNTSTNQKLNLCLEVFWELRRGVWVQILINGGAGSTSTNQKPNLWLGVFWELTRGAGASSNRWGAESSFTSQKPN